MNTLADGNGDAPNAQATAGCITAYVDAVVADVNIFNFGDYNAASKKSRVQTRRPARCVCCNGGYRSDSFVLTKLFY